MEVNVINEGSPIEAFFGIGLSFGLTSGLDNHAWATKQDLFERIQKVALKLAFKGGGENKFLRQIPVSIDIDAPMFWWKEMSTYKVSTTAQSESTMHSITKKLFDISMFETECLHDEMELLYGIIDTLNKLRARYFEHKKEGRERQAKDTWYKIISLLPACWKQRRIWTGNYAILQNIVAQRENHRLKEWHKFIFNVLEQINMPEYVFSDLNKDALDLVEAGKYAYLDSSLKRLKNE